LNAAKIATAPYLSLRYARIGRIGEDGQLPSGWNAEHLSDIEVVDVNSPGQPWLTLALAFHQDSPSDYVGLCVGAYLPAPKGSTVALAGEVTLGERNNIEATFLIVREWERGGRLADQTTKPLKLDDAQQLGFVFHQVNGQERVIQPMFMIKRRTASAGTLSLTLKGLAFGVADDYPDWLQTKVGAE